MIDKNKKRPATSADTTAVTPPEFPNSLINEPKQTNPGLNKELGPLVHLLGTWTNQNLGSTKSGGRSSPYSYNIMPLPSFASKYKYILKNFKYYEEITFSAIHGNAPNRGGNFVQNANVIFYEQRVYFAEGPAKDKLVHAENGSWLFLDTGQQSIDPYALKPYEHHPGPIPPQSPSLNLAKQISVPHGNSILAQGGALNYPNYENPGPVSIKPYMDQILPIGLDTAPYGTKSTGNPFPELNVNPNQPLQDGAMANPCKNFINWSVDAKGSVTNIPFEKNKANVSDYSANYWLQNFSDSSPYTQLAYNQTIIMDIPINNKIVKFPHITCNTLTKI